MERRTAVIALGGGVVGDLAGFAAATTLRGLPFIQIPTTLLSQVDSSVGGKTGVNTRRGKNLVGAFYQPRMVLADTGTLGTLPPRELKAGYAEVAKAGLIGDAAFFAWCERHGEGVVSGDREAQAEAIKRACAFKAAVVGDDEREEKPNDGRALLNWGTRSATRWRQSMVTTAACCTAKALPSVWVWRSSYRLGWGCARRAMPNG